jgi:hypothetical protein
VNLVVHVHYPSADEETVAEDVDYARKTFGPSNRSGTDVMFDLNPEACPGGTPGPREIIACYTPGTANEGSVVSPRRIKVLLGKRTVSTLSHLMGQALGLKALAIDATGFPSNIMHSAPGDRGQKLTLGQVFRLNHFLSPATLPSCDPGPCPSLDADVGP